MLYLISTPIGNIEDISFRAIKTLELCDYILCEDTRRTVKLLSHYNIKKKLVSLNEINEKRKTPFIIEDLKSGKDIGLVSDSGTPGINDPGYYIIKECIHNLINMSPVPGASAFLAALICSGFPTDKFTYYGFLQKKGSKRKQALFEIKNRKETAILYESPYRLLKTLKEINFIMPEKNIVIGRELTKHFEEFLRGSSEELISKLGKISIKGEIVILIN